MDHCYIESTAGAMSGASHLHTLRIRNSHWSSGPYAPAALGLGANLTSLYVQLLEGSWRTR